MAHQGRIGVMAQAGDVHGGAAREGDQPAAVSARLTQAIAGTSGARPKASATKELTGLKDEGSRNAA